MARIVTVFIFLFCCLVSQAQTSFTASTNRQKVALNQTFQLSFKLENAKAKKFTPPSFEGFKVVNGPHRSQSTQMVNFDVTTSVTWTYVLQPTREGKITIGSAEAILGNKKVVKANRVLIEVGPPLSDKQQSNQQNSGGNDGISEATLEESLFLKQIIDKRDVYVGEQVTITYNLYNRVSLVNISPTKNPSYTGFWSQEIELDQNRQRKYEVIGNQRFEVITLKKDAVFPQKGGELTLTPLELDAIVRTQSRGGQPRSLFDEMFGSYRVRDVPVKLESNSSLIRVKELPGSAPKTFNGAVGKYKLETKLETTQAETDNPITLSVKVSGQGNIKMVDKPIVNVPGNFDVFDPKVKEYVSKKSSKVNGYKSYDYLVIPRSPGEYKLSSIKFTYFDPELERYVSEESGEYILNVEGEPGDNEGAAGGLSKEEVELLGSDIRYIKTKSKLKASSNLFASIPYFALCGSPFLLFIALFVIKRSQDNIDETSLDYRSKKAIKVARSKLRKANGYLKKNEPDAFYNEVQRSLWGYFSDKLNIDTVMLSRENILSNLNEKNVSSETITDLEMILDTCEMHLYAPSATSGKQGEIYQSTLKLITKLEKEI
ncbi:MAG: protein BatD [Chitinophagales bacterium]|nr:protein BatD [Chitinophagales bacterium]